jgi:hypothetical protein
MNLIYAKSSQIEIVLIAAVSHIQEIGDAGYAKRVFMHLRFPGYVIPLSLIAVEKIWINIVKTSFYYQLFRNK